MSYGEPQPCKNQCGTWIYFDKNSAVGHPSADKWIPLEYNNDSGIKTGSIHQCPNRPKQSQQSQQQQQPSQMQQHEQQSEQHQPQQEQSYLEKVTDESVQRGITALKIFSDLAVQIEGIETDCNHTRVTLDRIEEKVDKLLSLVYTEQQQQ